MKRPARCGIRPFEDGTLDSPRETGTSRRCDASQLILQSVDFDLHLGTIDTWLTRSHQLVLDFANHVDGGIHGGIGDVHGRRAETECIRHGALWGVGHTITLFLFGTVVLLIDAVIPSHLAAGLELVVGIMLVLLGADVIRRLRRERVHFHVHEHSDGTRLKVLSACHW